VEEKLKELQTAIGKALSEEYAYLASAKQQMADSLSRIQSIKNLERKIKTFQNSLTSII
jgi:hypothetical protein